MNWGIILIIALLVGLIVYLYAKDTGKSNPHKWFLGGMISALVLLFGASAIKKKMDQKK